MASSLLFLVPGCDHRRTVFSQSLIIKEGSVKKCRYRDTRLPKPYKFKKRYCWLSTENFLYAKTNDSQVILARFLRVLNKLMNLPYAYSNKNNSLHFALKYARILVGHYLFLEGDRYCPKKIQECFRAKWRMLCLFSFKYFLQHEQFGKLGNITRTYWECFRTA